MKDVAADRPPPEQWIADLKDAFRDRGALLEYLDIPESAAGHAPATPAMLVPRSFAAKMRRGDAADPLLLQVLPRSEELVSQAGFIRDPVGDESSSLGEGVIQKYPSRALIVTTRQCAVRCRFCFRRSTLADFSAGDHLKIDRILSMIESRPDVDEVILSGGDPLLLNDAELGNVLATLDRTDQIRTVRIHTRAPVVLPSRVQAPLVRILSSFAKTLVMVLHVNHPREMEEDTRLAIAALAKTGVLLLNQSVLLKGVNDSADALITLSKRLVAAGVVPYYLHQLDRVVGTHHFEVPVETGRAIIETMRKQGAGYLVPRYVREIPGKTAKKPL